MKFVPIAVAFAFAIVKTGLATRADLDPLRSGEICPRPVVPNGRVAPFYRNYYEHETVLIHCKHPYLRIGPRSATCLYRGNFTTLPDCVACKPRAPPNGFTRPRTKIIEVGQRVTYGCKSGYTLEEKVVQKCEIDGTFSGPEPSCKRDPTCDKPYSPFAEIFPDKDEYEIGDKITYKCKPHQVLKPLDASTDICLKDGNFTGTRPACMNSTEPVECKKPENLGRLVKLRPRRESYEVGTSVRFGCYDSSDQFYGDKTSTCRSDGTFAFKEEPMCRSKAFGK